MRPQLLPSLTQLWRDRETVQLGLDPRRAIVLSGLHSGISRVLAALDGHHTLADVSRIALRHGVSGQQLGTFLSQLSDANVLLNSDDEALPTALSTSTRRRIQPDLAALALTHHRKAADVFAHRTASTVVIYGDGRIAPVIGALLASSGVGRVHIYGGEKAAATDACVGGLLPSDDQRSYAIAAHEAIRRAAPETDTRPPHPSKVPEFVVLARGSTCGQQQLSRHAHQGAPHLPVLLRDGTAIVGPLVIPGQTACLHCLDLHRRDRDPAWPALVSQLATYPRRPEASHTALATAAAALAAAQVLAFLDGETASTIGAALELGGLGSSVRRRSWNPHPECNCIGRRKRVGSL
ncbi:MAG: TOMM precursor leader peptide-binding protein [Mycobacteriales bacterium]